MICAELEKKLTEQVNSSYKRALKQKDIASTLQALSDIIYEAMSRGDKVPLPGLGAFKVTRRASRKGRNPRTGEEIFIPSRKKVMFSAGKHVLDALNNPVSIHSRPIRRLTPQPTDRGRADFPSLKGGVTKKDFIGFAVLSTTFSPLKGEVSNHKGIFDENIAS